MVDASMEHDEREVVMALREEQKGLLFLVLKTVINTLDQKGVKS